MKKKKLLIGNYPPPFSGQSIAFKTIVDDELIKENSYVINTIEKSGKRGSLVRLIDYIKVIIKLIRVIVFKNIDTVYHIISSTKKGFYRDFVIIFISKLFNKQIIIHSHNGNYDCFFNDSSFWVKKMIKKTLNKVDKIILLSDKLQHTFSFLEKKDVFVFIPNGLPIDLNRNKEKILSGDKVNVLYLSNFIESKGYLDIIEAMIILKGKGLLENFTFHFAGNFMLNQSQDKSYKSIKEAKEIFFNKIKENKLENSFKYYGSVFGEEKDELFKKAHVFLLPTYYNIEAQPITIIEALSYGCAIYSSNYRAIPEMLFNKINGEFIEPNNPLDIAFKLEKIDKEKIKKYSKKSLEIFKTKFTKEKHLEKIKELFQLN